MADLPKIQAYTGNSNYIFVSYAHKDRASVYPIIEALQKKYNVWFDEGIHYGTEWEDEIAVKLKNCSIFLFMITENSLNSDNCKDELYHARSLNKSFLNILINKDTAMPDWFSLRYARYQMCNYFTFSSPDAAISDIERKCTWFDSVRSAAAVSPSADKKPESGNSPAAPSIKREETVSANALYEEGKLLYDRKEYEKAAVLLMRAADMDHAAAQNTLGDCYYYGYGVLQSYEKAIEWFTKAAQQGNVYAQNSLGDCYYEGSGVVQSYEKAAEWFTKAAEKGYAKAQANLGACYYFGYGIQKDSEKAVYWYTKAAKQGHVTAQNSLGNFYYNGSGVQRDYVKAVYWYTKAAEQGNVYAQKSLGNCYYYGRGVPQNTAKAEEWYAKAKAQNNRE